MQRYLLLLAASFSLCTSQKYLSHWTQYRLTEMFESIENSTLSEHFSDQAWEDYQASLPNLSSNDQDMSRHLESFINPVSITKIDAQNYYAQSLFMVRFSNAHASWLQPIEMILTLNDVNGKVTIQHFEGKASKPFSVKNYAIERATSCKNK